MNSSGVSITNTESTSSKGTKNRSSDNSGLDEDSALA